MRTYNEDQLPPGSEVEVALSGLARVDHMRAITYSIASRIAGESQLLCRTMSRRRKASILEKLDAVLALLQWAEPTIESPRAHKKGLMAQLPPPQKHAKSKPMAPPKHTFILPTGPEITPRLHFRVIRSKEIDAAVQQGTLLAQSLAAIHLELFDLLLETRLREPGHAIDRFKESSQHISNLLAGYELPASTLMLSPYSQDVTIDSVLAAREVVSTWSFSPRLTDNHAMSASQSKRAIPGKGNDYGMGG